MKAVPLKGCGFFVIGGIVAGSAGGTYPVPINDGPAGIGYSAGLSSTSMPLL